MVNEVTEKPLEPGRSGRFEQSSSTTLRGNPLQDSAAGCSGAVHISDNHTS